MLERKIRWHAQRRKTKKGSGIPIAEYITAINHTLLRKTTENSHVENTWSSAGKMSSKVTQSSRPCQQTRQVQLLTSEVIVSACISRQTTGSCVYNVQHEPRFSQIVWSPSFSKVYRTFHVWHVRWGPWASAEKKCRVGLGEGGGGGGNVILNSTCEVCRHLFAKITVNNRTKC